MLQGNSRLYVDIITRTPTGARLCYIFLAEDRSLAFKFDNDSREVIIDKFNTGSENSFKFELSLAEKFLKIKIVENC